MSTGRIPEEVVVLYDPNKGRFSCLTDAERWMRRNGAHWVCVWVATWPGGWAEVLLKEPGTLYAEAVPMRSDCWHLGRLTAGRMPHKCAECPTPGRANTLILHSL